MLLPVTCLRMPARQRVPAVQVAMFLPGQPGAAALAVTGDRADAALGQVLPGVLRPQLPEDWRIGPDVGEALLAQPAGRDAQLDARIDHPIRADQGG